MYPEFELSISRQKLLSNVLEKGTRFHDWKDYDSLIQNLPLDQVLIAVCGRRGDPQWAAHLTSKRQFDQYLYFYQKLSLQTLRFYFCNREIITSSEN